MHSLTELKDPLKSPLKEFIIFGIKQARACIFAGSFFVLLFASNHILLFGFARYDFLFVAALAIQAILYFTKLETKDEVKVIFFFHIIGLVLELYKTNPTIGSWSYPEEGFFKIATVPLYSGFMYAAVGSYISQAWKIMRVELMNYTNYGLSVFLCVLIYLNFFTNHYIYDFRWFLMLAVFILFWKAKGYFTVIDAQTSEIPTGARVMGEHATDRPTTGGRRYLPLNLSFFLIAFFIWIAENISTYLGAWKYPDQIHAWSVVSTQKITSWFLLVIISFILVAYLKHYKKDVLRK